MNTHYYNWSNTTERELLKGKPCQIIGHAQGEGLTDKQKRRVTIRFEDGQELETSYRALRKLPDNVPVFDEVPHGNYDDVIHEEEIEVDPIVEFKRNYSDRAQIAITDTSVYVEYGGQLHIRKLSEVTEDDLRIWSTEIKLYTKELK